MVEKILILVNKPHKPPMEKLRKILSKKLPQYKYQIVSQLLFAYKIQKSPPAAIITYNKNLYSAKNLQALIQYTNTGGKLIVLHHNLSSMMLRRPEWQDFCRVLIERGDQAKYPWSVIEGGDSYLININKNHPVPSNNVIYGTITNEWKNIGITSDPSQIIKSHELTQDQKNLLKQQSSIPAILLPKSEYFINQILLPEPSRELLLGIYFTDIRSGRQFLSANGGWTLSRGKGRLFYFMPGHTSDDFNNEFCQIIANAIIL